MSKTPSVRFAGYTEDWEQRKAKELCNIATGKSNTQDQVEDGIYPFYIRSDIPVKSNKYLYDCEAVITIGDGNIGRVFHYVNGKFDLHQRCYKMTDFQDIWGKYFYYFFSTRFYDRAMKMTAKATVDSVRLEMISEMDIWKPIQIDEQKKIAEFFTNLDNLITLHQRKYEKLVNIKKSMLYKMFPQNGSKVPEIRFAGFTGDWEQRKLKDIASSFEYGLNAAAKEFDEVNKYLRITDIDDASRAFRDDDVTSPDANLSLADNYRLQKGDVLFARTGASVGKSYIYRKSDGLVYFAGFLIRARIKPEYSEEFIFQNTLTTQYEKYIQFTSQRSGQPGVNAQEYGEYSLLMPDYQEQKIIGNILHQIDNLIILHHRKLEKLKQLKQAMLHKMFV